MSQLDPRPAVAAAFAAQGLGYATVVTSLPAFKERFGLGDTALSVVLLSVVLCAALGSVLADLVAVRRSSRAAVCAGLTAQAVALVVVVLAPVLGVAVAGVLLFGVGLGAVDAANNMQGVLVQRRFASEFFGRLYAVWSVAAISGALLAAGAASLDVVPMGALLVAAVVQLAVVGYGRGALDPARAAHTVQEHAGERRPLPHRGIWLVGGMVFAVYVADSAVSTWSTVYLQDTLEASARIAPLAYACYQGLVLVSRLVADVTTARVGRRAVAVAALLLGVAGAVVVALVPHTAGAFAGFALLGVTTGLLVPLAFSAAGDLLPSRSDEVVARVNLFNYAGALVGAVSLGLVGGAHLGLAFLLPAVVLVLGLPVVRRLPARLRRDEPVGEPSM